MTEPKFFVDLYDLDGKVIGTFNLASIGDVLVSRGRWVKAYEKKKRRLYYWNKHKWPWWKPSGIDRDSWFDPYWKPASVYITTWENKHDNNLEVIACRSNEHAQRLCIHLAKQLERFKYET